ncbi:hypothetical protein B0J15DRAFT_75035 [Fusarium solani]|uniref:Uncharacterized protein n=1 Tax=Fusarium solani TaxID=169388 RepID=A0A9P9K750_FUSSL|nr:uncharacterized protein B0J15DRAFT_75035 [Fusarium solani]KAH7246821.1 hypothetical protein B0J15DRAFT_75035 [Fusarium solani]
MGFDLDVNFFYESERVPRDRPWCSALPPLPQPDFAHHIMNESLDSGTTDFPQYSAQKPTRRIRHASFSKLLPTVPTRPQPTASFLTKSMRHGLEMEDPLPSFSRCSARRDSTFRRRKASTPSIMTTPQTPPGLGPLCDAWPVCKFGVCRNARRSRLKRDSVQASTLVSSVGLGVRHSGDSLATSKNPLPTNINWTSLTRAPPA